MSTYDIILFYSFVPIDDPEKLRDEQRALCEKLGLKGRLLIACEGINGTFEGTSEAIATYTKTLRKDPRFSDIIFKMSEGTGSAFPRLDVRVRKEIVTLGAGDFDVRKETAAEITADELEALYDSDEDFVVLDLRNDYEIESGAFEKTVHPQLRNFRDLPQKLSSIAHLKNTKVISVCTGGIRCEKATCLLRREGFENLYQLKDGIHTYMQKYPASHFKGTLFVFDGRMVTPVIDSPSREVIGSCRYCGKRSEDYYSDDSQRPSLKVICCTDCIAGQPQLRTA